VVQNQIPAIQYVQLPLDGEIVTFDNLVLFVKNNDNGLINFDLNLKMALFSVNAPDLSKIPSKYHYKFDGPFVIMSNGKKITMFNHKKKKIYCLFP